MVLADYEVAKSLYEQAVGGNVTAAIWWTKARMTNATLAAWFGACEEPPRMSSEEHLSTESGRRQTARGASNATVHEERIRKGGGALDVTRATRVSHRQRKNNEDAQQARTLTGEVAIAVAHLYLVHMLRRTLPAGFIAPCLPTKTDTALRRPVAA